MATTFGRSNYHWNTPLREDNARTTAVFVIKYLHTIGFKVDNDLFADNSLHFYNQDTNMDLSRHFILLNGEPRTSQISSIEKNEVGGYRVLFKNNARIYNYYWTTTLSMNSLR